MSADQVHELREKWDLYGRDLAEIESAKRLAEDPDAPRAPEREPVELDPEAARAWEEMEAAREAVSSNGSAPKLKLSRTVDEFIDEDEPEHDFKVPGVIETRERVILTGGEGMGKSTFLRQFGYQASQGLHPFGGADFEPIRVLLLDLENPKAQLRRKLRELRVVVHQAVGDDYDPTRLRVIPRPEGLNLLEPEDREWLYGRLDANRPDLLIVGPLYKLALGDPTSEEVARLVAGTLDVAMAKFGVSVLVEAHSPYASGGGKRPMRPYGASLWSRWPDFGIHLAESGALIHWRGPRDERQWPEMLTRGGEWPWTAATTSREVTFARLCDVIREHGCRLPVRELGQLLQVPKSTVQRAIQANQKQYDALLAEVTK
jgi:hypothetical protein